MHTTERVAIWFALLALMGMVALFWAAANKRIDELTPQATPTSTTTTTTPTNPLATDLLGLKQQVNELQANRGLTGPEVRELVETLLPAPNNPPTDETCSEPPCVRVTTSSTSVVGRSPGSTTPATTTTEKRRRRR